VLSTVNDRESPTAVLARREMLDWRLLQLEPSVLRAPDGFDAPSQLAASAAHLPATLFRLFQEPERHAGVRPPPPGEAHHAPEKTGERALTQIANRLCELIEQVGRVRIDRDDKRELLTLLLTDRYGTELPAKALSDGTLRFLALANAEMVLS